MYLPRYRATTGRDVVAAARSVADDEDDLLAFVEIGRLFAFCAGDGQNRRGGERAHPWLEHHLLLWPHRAALASGKTRKALCGARATLPSGTPARLHTPGIAWDPASRRYGSGRDGRDDRGASAGKHRVYGFRPRRGTHGGRHGSAGQGSLCDCDNPLIPQLARIAADMACQQDPEEILKSGLVARASKTGSSRDSAASQIVANSPRTAFAIARPCLAARFQPPPLHHRPLVMGFHRVCDDSEHFRDSPKATPAPRPQRPVEPDFVRVDEHPRGGSPPQPGNRRAALSHWDSHELRLAPPGKGRHLGQLLCQLLPADEGNVGSVEDAFGVPRWWSARPRAPPRRPRRGRNRSGQEGSRLGHAEFEQGLSPVVVFHQAQAVGKVRDGAAAMGQDRLMFGYLPM